MNIVTQLVRVRKETWHKIIPWINISAQMCNKSWTELLYYDHVAAAKGVWIEEVTWRKMTSSLGVESIVDCKSSIFFPGRLEFLLSSLNHLWQISSSLFQPVQFYQRPLTKAWTDHQKMQTCNEAAASPITESIKRFEHRHQDRFASESWNTFTGIQHTIQCSNGAWLERVI